MADELTATRILQKPLGTVAPPDHTRRPRESQRQPDVDLSAADRVRVVQLRTLPVAPRRPFSRRFAATPTS